MIDPRDRSEKDADQAEEAPADHAEINPARRRDRAETPKEVAEEHEPGERPVPPEQSEPLDPLGPGGIGA